MTERSRTEGAWLFLLRPGGAWPERASEAGRAEAGGAVAKQREAARRQGSSWWNSAAGKDARRGGRRTEWTGKRLCGVCLRAAGPLREQAQRGRPPEASRALPEAGSGGLTADRRLGGIPAGVLPLSRRVRVRLGLRPAKGKRKGDRGPLLRYFSIRFLPSRQVTS